MQNAETDRFQEIGMIESKTLTFTADRNSVTEGLTPDTVFFRASKTIFNIDGVKGAGIAGFSVSKLSGGKSRIEIQITIRKSYGHTWEAVTRELEHSFQLALY